MPLLDAEFPGFRQGLKSLSRKLSLAGDLVRQQAHRLQWSPAGTGFTVPAPDFIAAHPAARAWSLLRLYDRFGPDAPRRLPWRFLAPALRLEGVPADGILLRGHGATLRARDGMLTWGPDIASGGKKGYFIIVSEARSAEIREAGVRVSLTRDPDEHGGGRGGIVILAGNVRPPIVLRSKRKGDSIRRLAGGAVSVKELLIGMKNSRAPQGADSDTR